MVITREQTKVVESAHLGYNITLEAVAGAGKTTTILHVARKLVDKPILLITYSRVLMDDTLVKAQKWNILNLKVLTFHAFCNRNFGPCMDDRGLVEYVGTPPLAKCKRDLARIKTLVIDEAQDMTPICYNFILDKLKYFDAQVQLILIGDPRQNIYSHMGSTSSYLRFPEKYWPGRQFERHYLSTSFRITPAMGHFVNELVCSQYHPSFEVQTCGRAENPPVEYHWVDIFKDAAGIIRDKAAKFGHGGITVMAYSIKGSNTRNALVAVANQLVEFNLIHLRDIVPHPRVLKNKLVVTTIHKQKGSENDCYILLLDCSLQRFSFARENVAFLNLLYVALTRARQQLVIIGDKRHSYLDLWGLERLERLTRIGALRIFGAPSLCSSCKRKCRCLLEKMRSIAVTEIIKFKSLESLTELVAQQEGVIEINKLARARGGSKVYYDSELAMEGTIEPAQMLYGQLVPLVAELILFGTMAIVDDLVSSLENKANMELCIYHPRILATYSRIMGGEWKTGPELIDRHLQDLGFLANCVCCFSTYHYSLRQIKTYDDLDGDMIWTCAERIINFHRDNKLGQMETKCERKFTIACRHCEFLRCFVLGGRIDAASERCIVEYKMSYHVQATEHLAQLILYLYLSRQTRGYLFYPLTNEKVKVQISNKKRMNARVKEWLGKVWEKDGFIVKQQKESPSEEH